jgi:hypothetical protein
MGVLLKRPPETQKYLIHSADKCNMGAFMDRFILWAIAWTFGFFKIAKVLADYN